jgi:hypothetical protein
VDETTPRPRRALNFIITVPDCPRHLVGPDNLIERYRGCGSRFLLDRCHDLRVHRRSDANSSIVLEYARRERSSRRATHTYNNRSQSVRVARLLDPLSGFAALERSRMNGQPGGHRRDHLECESSPRKDRDHGVPRPCSERCGPAPMGRPRMARCRRIDAEPPRHRAGSEKHPKGGRSYDFRVAVTICAMFIPVPDPTLRSASTVDGRAL